ncbi:MAG: A/G-specific adenine glycosylase [Planctomycetes bacterium HGW-Planctomycetes-2]|nr:MAG: A/G-specific adenine glycosylase [Planctomycetes bacterium HGW-Planctomycetes-2]
MPSARDRRIADRLTEWFADHARDLPWRTPRPRDPYRSLVSEAMLQQTQVSRVVEKFDGFLARFPTVESLAAAPEQAVLAAWSGLGYYRRARHLRLAARAIVERHGGRVPADVESLRRLPGVGAYTAGAIAGIVFDQPVPAVDANARRVILRVEGKESPGVSERWIAARAGDIVAAATKRGPAAFNEGLMELGALVCSAASPACGRCPLRRLCRARAAGTQKLIRPVKPPTRRTTIFASCVLVSDPQGRLLTHARPSHGPGLWSGLWQPPTVERHDRHASPAELRGTLGVRRLSRVGGFDHATSHRLVRFEVWQGSPGIPRAGVIPPAGEFLDQQKIARLPLSSPHRRILLTMGTGAEERQSVFE